MEDNCVNVELVFLKNLGIKGFYQKFFTKKTVKFNEIRRLPIIYRFTPTYYSPLSLLPTNSLPYKSYATIHSI